MLAVTSSLPPAGAPTLAEVVWTRPEVQLPPLFRAVMSRLPLPSRWTLDVELVMFSISPVPQTPWPVSYCHWPSIPLPEPPLKSSLNTVVQPEGGPGSAAFAWVVATVNSPTSATAAPAAVSRNQRPGSNRRRVRVGEVGTAGSGGVARPRVSSIMACDLSRWTPAPVRPRRAVRAKYGFCALAVWPGRAWKRFRAVADASTAELRGGGWEYVVADN